MEDGNVGYHDRMPTRAHADRTGDIGNTFSPEEGEKAMPRNESSVIALPISAGGLSAMRKLPHSIRIPATGTIHAVADRHDLVSRAPESADSGGGTPLSDGLNPNDLWCADYKGEFQPGDKRYCHPLSVTYRGSRFLLLC